MSSPTLQNNNESNSQNQDINSSILGNFENKPQWYVIQTYSGFEEAARKILEQRIDSFGIKDRILEIYIPTRKVIKINVKGVKKEKDEIVHPGYIYIYMILDQEIGYIIQNSQYISKIPGTGETVVALEEGEVDRIKKTLQSSVDKGEKITISNYKIGSLVEILSGPFQNHSGRVCDIDGGKSQATVLIAMMGREISVEIPLAEINLMM